jgi:hypothetical protein
VISTTSEIGMAIITLGRLYFVLSWRPAPASDLAPCPKQTKMELLRFGTEGTLIPRYQ